MSVCVEGLAAEVLDSRGGWRDGDLVLDPASPPRTEAILSPEETIGRSLAENGWSRRPLRERRPPFTEDEVDALMAERETLFEHAEDLEGQLTQVRAESDASRGRLSSDIEILLEERERLSSEIRGFLSERETLVEHAADLDAQLVHIRSRPSHRLLGALKDLLRVGSRGR